MQHVKTQECIRIHLVAAQHQEVHSVAENRHGRGDIRADGDGPKSQLVPGQQISRIAQEQCNEQQNNANDPIEFAGRAVGATVKHLEHMGEHQQDHGMRRPAMKIAQKQSRGDDELQVLGIGVGLRDGWMVVKHQQNAGDHQNQEGPEGQRAQIPRGAKADHAPPHLGRKQV